MKKQELLSKFAMLSITGLAYFHTCAQVANTLSPSDKVFGLSKFWQEVNYNFVYLNNIDRKSWDSAYKALIPQVQATQNDHEYFRLMEKFCALLKDGHTEINRPSIQGLNFMFNTFGDHLVVLKRIDNKVIVIRTFKKDEQLIPLGSEIEEVNGQTIKKYIQDSIAPFISSSTDYVRNDIASQRLLGGVAGSSFRVKFKKPNGEEAICSLTHARPTDTVLYPAGDYLDEQKRQVVEWKTLPNDVVYVALNTFNPGSKVDSIFEDNLPLLGRSKGIIIDLRYNGGGDDGLAFNILRHFIKDTVLVASSSIVRTLDPYLKAIGRSVKISDTTGNKEKREAWLMYNGYAVYGKPGVWRSKIRKDIKKLLVPVVILTGHNTESAAEDFLVGADNESHIVRMGEPTNGSSGMPYAFDLPGGGHARICVKKDMFPDGHEFVGSGIQPHIKVTPTVKDYLENKDVVLEAALKYLGDKKSSTPN